MTKIFVFILTLCSCMMFTANAATINLMDFDQSINGGNNNTVIDGSEFQNAVNATKISKGVLFIPAGTYNIYTTINVTGGEFTGCMIEGENTEAVKIVSYLQSDNPVFSFRGGSGAPSNVGIRNVTFVTASTNLNLGTAILIDGQDFAQFKNIKISNFKYGIYLYNNQPDPDGTGPLLGSFSEANIFENIWIDYCTNAFRLEQGVGEDSFHGNVFNNCYINIGANQIGFNHVSGYYYNGRFRLFMWSHDNSAVYINATGNAEHNIGDITYESGLPGKLTGNGRFWFNGSLTGIGGLNDISSCNESWQKVFACDNYWTAKQYGTTAMSTGPLNLQNGSYNNPVGFFSSLKKNNVESVILNTYNGSPENGLYLGQIGYQKSETDGNLGVFISGAGDKIHSYNSSGVSLESSNGDAIKLKNDGKLTFKKSDGTETALNFGNNNMTVNGSLSVQNGNVYGYQVISGSVVCSGNQTTTDWKDAITFNNFISGELILTSGNQDNQYAPASNYKLHWQPNQQKMEAFAQSPGWNGTYNEYHSAKFTGKKIQIGSNGNYTIWYTFIGVKY